MNNNVKETNEAEVRVNEIKNLYDTLDKKYEVLLSIIGITTDNEKLDRLRQMYLLQLQYGLYINNKDIEYAITEKIVKPYEKDKTVDLEAYEDLHGQLTYWNEELDRNLSTAQYYARTIEEFDSYCEDDKIYIILDPSTEHVSRSYFTESSFICENVGHGGRFNPLTVPLLPIDPVMIEDVEFNSGNLIPYLTRFYTNYIIGQLTVDGGLWIHEPMLTPLYKFIVNWVLKTYIDNEDDSYHQFLLEKYVSYLSTSEYRDEDYEFIKKWFTDNGYKSFADEIGQELNKLNSDNE
jgi:hypothetical protein